jgi:DNA-directed RNA polymerase specialized sigma24 family protein
MATINALEPYSSLSLEALQSGVLAEEQRFRRGEPRDDCYALEVFRRAVVEGDDAAWEALQSLYQRQVFGWSRGLNTGASIENVAALAWEKFWQCFKADKFARAEGLPAIQRYLKACVQTTVIDTARQERQTSLLSLDRHSEFGDRDAPSLAESLVDTDPLPEESLVQDEERGSIRQIVSQYVRSNHDRAIIHLRYELGLTSAEIQARRPDLFPIVADVYQTTRNLLDRLRRDHALQTSLERA